MPHNIPDLPAWLWTALAAIGGFISSIALALINRKPALDQRIDERLATLLEADQKRLEQMSAVLTAQSRKLDRLQRTVTDLTGHVTRLEALLERHSIPIPPRPEPIEESCDA